VTSSHGSTDSSTSVMVRILRQVVTNTSCVLGLAVVEQHAAGLPVHGSHVPLVQLLERRPVARSGAVEQRAIVRDRTARRGGG